MREAVVLLHGVWMPAAEMLMMKRHLEAAGPFEASLFAYPSVRATLDESSAALAVFVHSLGTAPVHLVGHSLGGIVALRALHDHSTLPPGRMVCLGSPLKGSQAAESLDSHALGRHLIGDTLPEATVHEPAAAWAGPVLEAREVGSLAGDLAAGVGRLLVDFGEANDGSVAVSETRLDGLKDHLVMHETHSGMVWSKDVAEQTAAFLRRGEFLRER
ncbi:MAG: alpha/beta fold hydrolase [Pseudomonadota bacterium]